MMWMDGCNHTRAFLLKGTFTYVKGSRKKGGIPAQETGRWLGEPAGRRGIRSRKGPRTSADSVPSANYMPGIVLTPLCGSSYRSPVSR